MREDVNLFIASLFKKQFPTSLYTPMKYAMSSGGKKLRPLLLLLSAKAFGGDVKSAVPAAAAVEILHNFTLVHDDIMDDDQTRRGRKTVHKEWDADTALLAGDGLVALAYQSLFSLQSPEISRIGRIFTDGIMDVCEGQAFDREFETRDQVPMNEYLDMICKKTGRLLSMCTQIGALLAGACEEKLIQMREFGESLGIAFQIQDDLLDITTEERILGKDFGSDVKQKKKTFMLVHALQSASGETIKYLNSLFESQNIGAEDVHAIRSVFEKTGTLAATRQAIESHFQRAKTCLKAALPDGAEDLTAFVQMVFKRRF